MKRKIEQAKSARPPIVRLQKAVEMLGFSESTLRRHAKTGLFTIIKRGKLSYVRTSEIDAYLDPNATEMVD